MAAGYWREPAVEPLGRRPLERWLAFTKQAMKHGNKPRFAELPKDYAGLCRQLMPRPIHDRVEYGNVTEVTDAMALRQEEFTPDQKDYFDLLCGLVEEFDREQVRWPKLNVRARLQHLLQESGLSAADLSRLLGAVATLEP